MKIIEVDEKGVQKVKETIKKLHTSKKGQSQMFRINKKGFKTQSNCFNFLTPMPTLIESIMCSKALFPYKVVCSTSRKDLETQTVPTKTDQKQTSTAAVVLITIIGTIGFVTICALILHFDVLHIRVSCFRLFYRKCL